MADLPSTPAPRVPRPAPAIALSVRRAALALDLSPRTVEALAQRGDLPSFRVGRRRLFAVESLRAWTARQTGAEEGAR